MLCLVQGIPRGFFKQTIRLDQDRMGDMPHPPWSLTDGIDRVETPRPGGALCSVDDLPKSAGTILGRFVGDRWSTGSIEIFVIVAHQLDSRT